MNGKTKPRYKKENFITYVTSLDLPDEYTFREVNEHYVEICTNEVVDTVLIDGENWDEAKLELAQLQKRKLQEKDRIRELAKQDELTSLYKKESSRELIEDYIKSNPDDCHALMIIDIDNFRTINENLGYLFGDTVLTNLAHSLKEIFYETDIVSRIGGDEFLIFLKNIKSRELLESKAHEIFSIFHNTYTGENKDYKMSCTIGIAEYPKDGQGFLELFNHANAALIYGRRTKELNICFFDSIENMNIEPEEANTYYNNYNIGKTKAYGTNNFDKEITAFAFDIMSRTKDVRSAINLLLHRVRTHFNCKRVCIIEKSVMTNDFNITYLCKVDGKEESTNITDIFNKNIKEYVKSYNENGIFLIRDTKELKSEDLVLAFENSNSHSLLSCSILEDDDYKGCVCIEDTILRDWSQSEQDSLVTITKIISSYLLKLRASERANKQLYNIRNFDALTGLPTLHKFKKDAKLLLSNNIDKIYAIIYSDISQFKHINDSLGYDVGDRILVDFSNFLKDNMNYESIARLSEDNFVILCEYIDEPKLVKELIEKYELFNVIQRAKYTGYKFVITSGLSVIVPDEDITVALDNANIARKSIKSTTKTTCKVFNELMKLNMYKELEITQNMERALKDGEFIVYIQPKVELKSNELVGGEALVRWKKPDNTIISPDEFIPLFEKNGFIVSLDFYIYEEVLKTMQTWINTGMKLVPVSLNVSRIHLNDEDFVSDFKQLVDQYEVPYHLLELELTESIFLHNSEIALDAMRALKELGLGVSIDDFGSGYSSLNLLKNMATDIIKLDKEFFSKGEIHNEEKIIVTSIIRMAKQLNLKVLSEGVETKNQSDFLKSVECDMAQGYLFARPMPIEEFEKILLEPELLNSSNY